MMDGTLASLLDLLAGLPWLWIWIAGWSATCLLTIYPLGGRRIDNDDLIRFAILAVLWVPFLVAVVHALRSRDPGASPTAGAGSGLRRRES